MAKKFTPPTVADVTYHYLGLFKQPARQKDFDSAEQQFQKALIRTNDVHDIRAALALDKHNALPVQMKSPAYERLLVLSGRSIPLLREYAQIMYDYGPEWQGYADMLWQEANELEKKEEQL